MTGLQKRICRAMFLSLFAAATPAFGGDAAAGDALQLPMVVTSGVMLVAQNTDGPRRPEATPGGFVFHY